LELQKQLAQQWDDVNQPAPSALYYEAVGEAENTYATWLKAGDLFTSAFQNTQDSLIQPALVNKARNAYDRALKLQPNSLDAKTGLGVSLVNGTNPMEGIQLLLAVVKEEPEHLKANLNLGLFSMKSGQFDKAVERFKTVVKQNPNPEAYFYLASSYENLGAKTEAIAAYQKCKELAADVRLSEFVDKKIQELNK
jgi:cytochrome c-type biogenesis protein CcmH/NrfG